jgi:hypothetical protein
MGEILGIGTTHVPYLMSAPENMLRLRGVLCGFGEKLSGRRFQDPPEARAQLGDDPERVAREHHRLHWEAFARLAAYIDEVRPDAILMIGDDQDQCFQTNNLPPYAMYVGASVDATPFHMSRFPGDAEYVKQVWGVDTSHTYHWPCHAELSSALRDGLIRRGFDMASTDDVNSDRWTFGLGHAHANTQLFLRNEDGRVPLVPLFVNCYGPDLAIFSRLGPKAGHAPKQSSYPAAPSSERLYAMGEAIRAILAGLPWRVLVCPSSTWSHSWLTTRYDRMRMDVEGNREIQRWLERGEGHRLRRYDSPQLEANGDHELRNWIVAAGIMGDRPLEVTASIESWVSTGYRVFGIWR